MKDREFIAEVNTHRENHYLSIEFVIFIGLKSQANKSYR